MQRISVDLIPSVPMNYIQMRNKEIWKPTKYIFINGKLRASRNHEEVAISSRLITDLVARFYDDNIPEHVKGRLIDLGCGNVPFYEAYKNYIDDNTCVDWANTLHENPFLDHEQDLNQKLNFPDESFDTIILSDVLEHIRKPELLMQEMYRILAPDGKLLMNAPFLYWLHEEPHDYFRYTAHALKSMAEDSGLTIIKLEPCGGAPEVLADISSKLAMRLPFLGKYLAMAIQKATWIFVRTKFGRRVSANTSKRFPLEYVMVAEKIKV
jgi:SAM-dependent methyltransferase